MVSRTSRVMIVLVAAAACCAGCGSGEKAGQTSGSELHDTFRPAPPWALAYDCDDGTRLVAAFENEPGRDEAVLFMPGRTVRLPKVISASGAKYADGEIVFWMKGEEEALLETGDGRTLRCTVNRARTKWEDAKLRGVDYRALGNESGWVLELGPEWIVFVVDYGETRHVFPLDEPEVDRGARRTVWRSTSAVGRITIVVSGESCEDDMSGEPFESTVEIDFDGRTYRGCGRALH